MMYPSSSSHRFANSLYHLGAVLFVVVAAICIMIWYRHGDIWGPSDVIGTMATVPRVNLSWMDKKIVPRHVVTSYREAGLVPQSKIRQWKCVSPGWNVRVFGDTEARDYIARRCGREFSEWFFAIPDGPIRGDVFRVVYLYYEGGVWLDADVELVSSLDDIEGTHTGSVSTIQCCTHRPYTSQPIMIAACRYHPFMLACLRVYKEMHRRRVKYRYWAFSIVTVFREVSRHINGVLPKWVGFEKCDWCDGSDNSWVRWRDLRTCRVSDPNGRVLLKNRSDDYCPFRHKFTNS